MIHDLTAQDVSDAIKTYLFIKRGVANKTAQKARIYVFNSDATYDEFMASAFENIEDITVMEMTKRACCKQKCDCYGRAKTFINEVEDE